MTPEEVNKIANHAAGKAVEKYADQHKCSGCLCEFDMKKHRQDHEFISGAMAVLAKIDNIKWSVIKAVAIALVFAALAMIGLKLKP